MTEKLVDNLLVCTGSEPLQRHTYLPILVRTVEYFIIPLESEEDGDFNGMLFIATARTHHKDLLMTTILNRLQASIENAKTRPSSNTRTC